MKRSGLLSLLVSVGILLSLVGASGRAAEGTSFEGQILERVSKKGVADLSVKLIPPKAAKKPEKITISDEEGKFRFTGLERGKLLLEVRQGVRVLYRKEINTDDKTIKIELNRKKS